MACVGRRESPAFMTDIDKNHAVTRIYGNGPTVFKNRHGDVKVKHDALYRCRSRSQINQSRKSKTANA